MKHTMIALVLWGWAAGFAADTIQIDLDNTLTSRPIEPGIAYTFQLINYGNSVSIKVKIERESILVDRLSIPGSERSEPNALTDAQPDPIDLGEQLPLNRGEKFVITVKWTDAAGKDKEKVFTFSTGARGEWRTSYGFVFLPNENEDYFSKANDDNTFTITAKEENDDLGFVPTAMFTWFPKQDESKNWSGSWVGGLGFDFQNPVVLAGYGVTYNQNISFSLGAAFHQQNRLRGEYKDMQVLKETLAEDALIDKVYRANYFLGFSYRFSGNPFKKKAAAESSAAKN